jgi:hypothetical protein
MTSSRFVHHHRCDGFRTGMVVVEHLSVTGRHDRITRPMLEAVPLFWQFMIEKLGVHPTLSG